MQCPKCGVQNPDHAVECQKCGVIFAKINPARRRQVKRPKQPAATPKLRLSTTIFIGIGVIVVGLFLFGALGAGIDRVLNPPGTVEIAAENMGKHLIKHRTSEKGFDIGRPRIYGSFAPGVRTSASIIYSYIAENGRRKSERMFYLFDDSGQIIDTHRVTKAPVGLAENPWPSPN